MNNNILASVIEHTITLNGRMLAINVVIETEESFVTKALLQDMKEQTIDGYGKDDILEIEDVVCNFINIFKMPPIKSVDLITESGIVYNVNNVQLGDSVLHVIVVEENGL